MATVMGRCSLICRNTRIFGNFLTNRFLDNLAVINKINKASVFNESGAYDGDGKTTATVIQNDYGQDMNLISSYSPLGFRLSNKVFVFGPIIIFPTSVYSWNMNDSKDINLESLILFDLILPKIKLLVIGYGDYGEEYDSSIPMRLRKKGISCEMQPTCHAVTTYNYLAADAIHVAGAFIPPREVAVTDKDYGESHYMDFLDNVNEKRMPKGESISNITKYISSNEKRYSPKS